MPRITYVEKNGKRHVHEVPSGHSVMEGAVKNSVPGIIAECGGAAACATCKVQVDPAWGARLPAPEPLEESMLDDPDNEPGTRLSCQLTVSNALDGLVVHLPNSQR